MTGTEATKARHYNPTEDEVISACVLFDPAWERMGEDGQEKMIVDACRWLKVWGYVLPNMDKYSS